MADETKDSDRAEQPTQEVRVSDRVVEIHPPGYPLDPLEVFDRWRRPTESLRDLWRGSAGFLVCGGPSLKTLPIERLKERGIVSLGINNASGFAPVRAATWSDPTEKFHHGISLDPAVLKLVPEARLNDAIAVKLPSGEFAWADMQLGDCPNVWGFNRNCEWFPEKFLTDKAATWGNNDAGVALTKRPKIIFTFFLGLRLLHYLGCRRIYLLGADFAMTDAPGGGYAFNEARDAGAAKCNNDHYRRANGMLLELAPMLKAGGFEVLNCNKQSSLEAFPFCPFDKALADCRGNVPAEPFDLNGWYAKVLTKSGNGGRKAAKRAAAKRREAAGVVLVPKLQTRAERMAARAKRIAARAARIAARAAKAAGVPVPVDESSVSSWSSTSVATCGYEGPPEGSPQAVANREAKQRARERRRAAKTQG